MEQIIFQNDRAVAIVDGFVPATMLHESYTVADVDNVRLCAACLELVPGHRAGQVVVRTSDPENPVTVHTHGTQECRKGAKNYRRAPREIIELRIAALRQLRTTT